MEKVLRRKPEIAVAKAVRQRIGMLRPIKFLRQRNRGGTSDFPIEAIERALLARGVPAVDNDASAVRLAGKVAARAGCTRFVAQISRTAFVVPIMGPCFYRFFPIVYGAETIPLAHDCWEPQFDRWAAFLKRARIRRAFFTARAAAEAMNARVPGLRAEWLPEGIELGFFPYETPLSARGIDILELGRRSNAFHEVARPYCEKQGYRHLYQKSARELVFDTREAFRRGMADTKLLICFPSSQTNPERSGTVETMTLRYLEGIACKSVILGHAPAELVDLFGYNPVVEVDFTEPARQIDQLLAHIDDHQPLVERNFARLADVGTWDVRIRDLIDRLSRDGIVPASQI